MRIPQRKGHRPEGEGVQPLAPRSGTEAAVAVAAVRRYRLHQRHRHLQNGGWKRRPK